MDLGSDAGTASIIYYLLLTSICLYTAILVVGCLGYLVECLNQMALTLIQAALFDITILT